MKYINLFDTQAAYDAAEKYYPNVSYIEATDEVAYQEIDPLYGTIVAKYTTYSNSSNVKLTADQELFSKITVDGEPLIIGTGTLNYKFASAGEHVVEYRSLDTTTIGSEAFYYCTDLTSVTIGNSVNSIGQSAFSHCTGLTSVTIPNSVTEIDVGVFDACAGLTSVTIGNSVASIGNYAFIGCTSLTSITSLNTTPPTISDATFDNVPDDCPIYVPAASVDAYEEASGWSDRVDYIQAIQ